MPTFIRQRSSRRWRQCLAELSLDNVAATSGSKKNALRYRRANLKIQLDKAI